MSVENDLVAAFEPWLTTDLEDFLRSIGTMFAEVELYAVDENDDMLGWSILLDPDLSPVAALPYLAQYVGEELPVGLTEAQQREWIKDAPNQRRGTVLGIVRAAQRTLTGTRLVAVNERESDEDHLGIITYTDQTPNTAQVRADILSVMPADIVLNYSSLGGQSWSSVNSNFATWQDVKNNYATWAEVRADTPGYTIFTHP